MMKCPHCKKKLILPNRAYINVETYPPHSAISATECCSKGIVISRKLSFEIIPYIGKDKKDSWGVKLKK